MVASHTPNLAGEPTPNQPGVFMTIYSMAKAIGISTLQLPDIYKNGIDGVIDKDGAHMLLKSDPRTTAFLRGDPVPMTVGEFELLPEFADKGIDSEGKPRRVTYEIMPNGDLERRDSE